MKLCGHPPIRIKPSDSLLPKLMLCCTLHMFLSRQKKEVSVNCWPGVLKCITEGSLPSFSSGTFFLDCVFSHVFPHPFVTVINCLIRITLHVSNCSLVWSRTACSGQAQEFSSVVFVFLGVFAVNNEQSCCLSDAAAPFEAHKKVGRTNKAKDVLFCFLYCVTYVNRKEIQSKFCVIAEAVCFD